MLDSDELPAAVTASAQFRDLRVPQFWDGGQALGREVARSLGATDWTAWDIYLFYPPGAEWTAQGLPAPAAALAQINNVVVGTRGTLPPVADQSALPEAFRGAIDVVGQTADLAALIAAVGEPFASRNRPQ